MKSSDLPDARVVVLLLSLLLFPHYRCYVRSHRRMIASEYCLLRKAQLRFSASKSHSLVQLSLHPLPHVLHPSPPTLIFCNPSGCKPVSSLISKSLLMGHILTQFYYCLATSLTHPSALYPHVGFYMWNLSFSL